MTHTSGDKTIPQNLCVYTLLIGDYEALNEQPAAASSAIPFICLTDNPSLTSKSWSIVQVPTSFPMDPIRSQRILKISPHLIPALSGYDHSLYIDNSVVLLEPPENFIGKLPADSGMGLPGHSFRDNVHDEFIEVARAGFDDQGRIFEQLHHYLANGDPALDEKPYWTAILLRAHRNTQVQRAMALWASHVLRYSRRDQLSFNTAIKSANLLPNRWEIDNFESFFHTWPHTPGRERFAGARNPQTSMMPLPTQLAQTRSELAAARLQLEVSRQEANGLLESIAVQATLLDEARSSAQEQRCAADKTSQLLEEAQLRCRDAVKEASERALLLEQQLVRTQEDARATLAAVHASTSWRVTTPLRRLKRWLT